MSRVKKYGFLFLAALVLSGGELCGQVPEGDMQLLRGVQFDVPRKESPHPYGIEPGRSTLSPLYHAASGCLWLWENVCASELCAPGGYEQSNTDYFKALVVEYGPLRAVVYGVDRMMRNTRIGRASTPTQPNGLIADDPKRYRP